MYDFALDPYSLSDRSSDLAVAQVPAASGYQFVKAKPVKGLDPLSVQFLDNNGSRGLQFYTNKGNAATGLTLGEAQRKGASGILDNNGFVTLNPNAKYRIRNEAGKDAILYEGLGEEGLRNVYSIAQNLSATHKKKANWGVDMLDPATGQWMRVAEDDPAKNTLGKIASVALPALGAFLLPGIGGALGASLTGALGSVGTGALGAALGSGVAGVAQGQGLGKILKNAALAGGLSYAGGSLLQGLGGAGNGLNLDVSSLTQQSLNNLANSGLSAGSAGALGGAAGGAAQAGANAFGDIVVQGSRSGLGGLAGAGAIGGGLSGVAAAGGTPPAAPPRAPAEPNKGGFDISKLPQYLQLGALGLGALESLFGGGGSGGNGTIPGGLGGGFNPVFNASLPTDAVIPGTGGLRGSQYGPRTMPAQDWNTYAMRPEQSFFKHVPEPVLARPNDLGLRPSAPPAQPSAPPAQPSAQPSAPLGNNSPLRVRRAPVQLARGGALPGSSESGEGLAVMGHGGGRDDTVPALLSDGEYVFDAETVALLGDGSNKAGAKKLDDLRVNIRKHKGRKLSKGKFSDNAKNADAYLSGARR